MRAIAWGLVLVGVLACSPALARGGGGHSGGHSGGSHTSRSGTGAHSVRGYVRKDGKYVAPHRQTNPNKTKRDNWSTKGNTNPDTGKPGTKNPD